MAGETGRDVSGWTTDTLHMHLTMRLDATERTIDGRFDALMRMLDERFVGQMKALDAALVAAEKAVTTAMTANEKAAAKLEVAGDKRFELLNELRTGVATKDQFDALEKRLTVLEEKQNRQEGRGAGLNAGWVYILGAITATGTVISIYVVFM